MSFVKIEHETLAPCKGQKASLGGAPALVGIVPDL